MYTLCHKVLIPKLLMADRPIHEKHIKKCSSAL